jgi:hypothetical protein
LITLKSILRIRNSDIEIFTFEINEIVTYMNSITKISKIKSKDSLSREIPNKFKYSKKEISKYTKNIKIINNK